MHTNHRRRPCVYQHVLAEAEATGIAKPIYCIPSLRDFVIAEVSTEPSFGVGNRDQYGSSSCDASLLATLKYARRQPLLSQSISQSSLARTHFPSCPSTAYMLPQVYIPTRTERILRQQSPRCTRASPDSMLWSCSSIYPPRTTLSPLRTKSSS